MYEIDLTDVVIALTKALEFTNEDLGYHHERVAYIAASIGKKLNLSEKDYETLFWAAYLHDLGAGAKLVDREIHNLDKYDTAHANFGYELLKDVPFFTEVAQVIKHHHTKYINFTSAEKNSPLAFLSQIIFAADQVDLYLKPNKLALLQRNEIERFFRKNVQILFNEDIVEAFLDLSQKESFWLDLTTYYIEDRLKTLRPKTKILAGEQGLKLLTVPFARIIDAKSPFTERHSLKVAALSGQLAEIAGLPGQKSLIEIAGLLHDIGKLSVSNKILEKNGPLNDEEYALIKTHPYYTYYLLIQVTGFEKVAQWAGYHHEQPNGQGYPFKLTKDQLDLPSRILAVADKWVALRENRPYRDALSIENALDILENMAQKEIVDPEVVKLLKENIDYLEKSQEEEIGQITGKTNEPLLS
ncbi:HD domain-containing phosphohydrolase [Carboxydothermus ferrireducens]|nr:HD domain-containing phosphohydrolase [Carboxydothermus ferrireducens]